MKYRIGIQMKVCQAIPDSRVDDIHRVLISNYRKHLWCGLPTHWRAVSSVGTKFPICREHIKQLKKQQEIRECNG